MEIHVKNILLIQGSARGTRSYSHRYARRIAMKLAERHHAALKVREVGSEPLPHVGEAFVTGIFTPPEQRSSEQARAIAVSDAAVDEVLAADLIVIASPMHNFGTSSAVKSWIDHIARAGRTFNYTEHGPKGLLTGKKVVLVLARGGIYSDGPMKAFDFQETYLRAVLGFLGITDVNVVQIEGVAMGEDALLRANAAADAQAAKIEQLAA